MQYGLIFLLTGMFVSFGAHASASDTMTPERKAAEELLGWLEGEWRFELGEQRGTRKVSITYPNHMISWRETFDGRDVEGRGYIGYDPVEKQFYSFAAHNIAGEYGFMTGALNTTGDGITYKPVGAAKTHIVEWRRETDDSFTYTMKTPEENGAYDTRWTAVFTRIE